MRDESIKRSSKTLESFCPQIGDDYRKVIEGIPNLISVALVLLGRAAVWNTSIFDANEVKAHQSATTLLKNY
jgi:hypothetical protein